MSKTLAEKKALVSELKENLSETQMAIVIDFKGLSIAEISDLRNRLRPVGAICKVSKNTLMERAIDGDQNWQPLTEYLAGSSAFLLVKEDFSGAIKAYQDFQKVAKKTELRGGVLEGRALSEAEVKAIGDLPSKEQLLGQVAGAINALATKLAVGINEIPTSLARGVKAISEQEESA